MQDIFDKGDEIKEVNTFDIEDTLGVAMLDVFIYVLALFPHTLDSNHDVATAKTRDVTR